MAGPSGRGRPHRPSRPLSASREPGDRERIAWLLRVNRRYGAGGHDARLGAFAEAMTAAGCEVSAGQLSRWESGLVAVPYRAVTAYEKVLGLESGRLVAAVDAVNRHHTPHAAPSRLDRRVAPDEAAERRASELLDRAVTGAEMAGRDWDELTSVLTALRHPVLRSRDWERLTQRLLSEQLIADGQAWRQRNEATHRLLWLPAARAHMISACAAVVRDPASQIVVEPLVMLDVVDHPDAAALIAGQVVDPVSERARRGALTAAAVKVRLRQFSPAQLRSVRAALAVPAPPRVDRPGIAERLTGEVVRRIEGRVDSTPDDMLARIVGEMLFSPDADARLHAAQLVGATPLRGPVADACCAELARPAVARDPVVAEALVGALPFVAGPAHRRTVERLILTPGLAVAGAAAWSFGHLPGASSDRFWAAALGRRLPGLVYALGMAGHQGRLGRIAADPRRPPADRAAARWWSNLPAALVRDARH
jgi:hypothetical protein